MRVVIDTNVLLVILPDYSPFAIVYEAFKAKKLTLLLTSEIILEYEEQLKLRYGGTSVDEELNGIIQNDNIELITPEFFWNLITADPDDNKFVDCAIAANADYIITNDAHFNVLKNITFPKVNILTLQAFITLLTTLDF